MRRYLAITIDVEPDCSLNWQYSNPLTFKGVTEGIGNILQPLFNKYNLKPTYLINNVVLEDKKSIEYLKTLKGRFEFGTHLHPEFIEPDKAFNNYAGKSGKANCCFYPPQIEREKIKNITELFKDSFGYKPLSFRAGRFSAGPNTIKSLSDFGYIVDTSVTPHLCWNDRTREKPVDFTIAKEQPYFIMDGSILEEEINGKMLQVPITISEIYRNPFKEIILSIATLRHSFRKTKVAWLRPLYSSTYEMKNLIFKLSKTYINNDIVVFNMMFHNVEVLPGLSPYTLSKSDCRRYIRQLDLFFTFCKTENILGLGLTDIYNEFRRK